MRVWVWEVWLRVMRMSLGRGRSGRRDLDFDARLWDTLLTVFVGLLDLYEQFDI
jgi:hypothetical protein